VTEQTAERSPRTRARIAGIFYLLTILTGALALSATGLLRSAMLLGSTACYVAVAILFYGLFRPVDRTISALAAVFSLAGCTVSILAFFKAGLSGPNPLIFFGIYCLLIGYLIFRSNFLPRILGVLMAFGGLVWLTYISPALSSSLSPYNMAPGVLGESALTIWLLIAGVNPLRWSERANAAGDSVRVV
jgi:hypothetical protein